MLQTVVERCAGVRHNVGPVHRLKQEVLERKAGKTLRHGERLGVHQLQFTPAGKCEPGISLWTDTDPVEAARSRLRTIRFDRDFESALVQGVNIVKKHRRARSAEDEGGIKEMEAPIAASNVMLIDPKSGAPTRVRARVSKDGTKERASAKSGDTIPHSR